MSVKKLRAKRRRIRSRSRARLEEDRNFSKDIYKLLKKQDASLTVSRKAMAAGRGFIGQLNPILTTELSRQAARPKRAQVSDCSGLTFRLCALARDLFLPN